MATKVVVVVLNPRLQFRVLPGPPFTYYIRGDIMIILLARGRKKQIQEIVPMLPITTIRRNDGNLENMVRKGERWTNYIVVDDGHTVDMNDFLKDENGKPIYEKD